jgi:hypothetical protein
MIATGSLADEGTAAEYMNENGCYARVRAYARVAPRFVYVHVRLQVVSPAG